MPEAGSLAASAASALDTRPAYIVVGVGKNPADAGVILTHHHG